MKVRSYRFHRLGSHSPEPRDGEAFPPDFGMHVTPLRDQDGAPIEFLESTEAHPDRLPEGTGKESTHG